MYFAIAMLVLFVILIIEIPFSIFINISIDRVLLEYMVESPIKTQGYAYIKNGELFHSWKNSSSKGGIDTIALMKKIQQCMIIKTLHIRGILGDEEIEKSMFQSVMFTNAANQILAFVEKSNPTAHLSQSHQIEPQKDKNIFIQTVAWLSVMDILYISIWIIVMKISFSSRDKRSK